MSTLPKSVTLSIARVALASLFCALITSSAFAEGTKQLSPDSTSECMLHTNASGFGNFAEYGGGDSSALYIRINDTVGPTRDTLYIGLSREAMDNGDLEAVGTYQFQILNPAGEVVHGPFFINNTNNNTPTWALAQAGPDVLDNVNGYSTAAAFAVFVPDTVGDFRIEFSDGTPNNIVNVKWFDLTVVNSNQEMPGRLWSRAWALRTPPANGNVPPECQFNQPFNGSLFSYTMDGFVSRIDFDSSGFQGLTFNVAFGLMGPGSTGDVVIDRMSIKGSNETFSAADHMVFISEPDTIEFPSPPDPCGEAEILGVTCFAADSFCIEVGVTRMGQVEILLDFAGNNGEYDPDTTDVLIAMVFNMPDTACLFWDGLKGDGSPIVAGDSIPTFFRYAQGVQHYAAFDVELLKFGFCVETIRPICPGVSTDLLYWDDSNITDDLATGTIDEGDPGTGQPKVQLNGCTCGIDSCRTWTTFQVGDPPTGTCQGTPYGYGENNTLNTWWFANTFVQGPLMLPIIQAEIVGDTFFCPGDSTELTAMGIPDTIDYVYAWSGPGGFMANTQSTGMIGVAGVYTVTVTDTLSNCSAVDSVEVVELTPPSTSITFTCTAPNSPNGDLDLTVMGAGPFTYLWSNDSITEDLFNVPPGEYSVIVTDTNGCMAFDTVLVEGCCELMILCPQSNGGLFSCDDDIPAPDTTLITIVDFCDSLTITSVDTDNGATGCADDTLVVQRTYTVTDATGATMQCVQFFQVVDDLAPELVGECPADTAIACGESIDTSVLGVPQFMDACDGVMLSFVDDSTGFDGTCTNDVIGTVTRTFYAMDSCGNVDSACVQTISVIDTIAPTFTVPADMTIECDEDTSPANTGDVTDTLDNCTAITLTFADVTIPGACVGNDTIQRTWTATDICGNSTSALQTITVEDTTPPSFSTPDDITIACDGDSSPASTGMVTSATDNCSSVTITFMDTVVPDGCPVNDTIFRLWTVSDDCGNSATDIQVIARLDTVAPTFTVPADVTIDCLADTSQANTGTVTDTADNCSTVTLTVSDVVVPGECPATDTIYRTFSAVDVCGNTNEQIQTIVLIDTTGPEITFCPPDTTVDCDASIGPADLGVATATDDCSTFTITFTDTPAGQCATDAPVMRLWIATDECGNSSTCLQTITIQDTVAPVVVGGTEPADTTLDCTASTDTSDLGVPAYTDNCSMAISLSVRNDSTGFDGTCTNQLLGTITRTFFAEDDCGNIDSSVVQIIMVQDTTPPTFTVPGDITIACDQDSLPATTGEVSDTLDNCGVGLTVDFIDRVEPDGCPATDTIFRNWIVSDICGNSAAQTQVIVRIDSVAPTFTTPADTTISCESPTDPATTGEILDTLDNCSDITVAFSDNVIPGVCDGEQTIERTWTVSDECGNSSTGLQIIMVIDTVPPVFTAPEDIVIECDQDPDPQITGDVTTATDNCNGFVITFTDSTVPGECPATDTTYRTWIVADDCGNSSEQVQVITRIDTVAPQLLTCPPDTTFECAAPADTLGLPTYSDNCGMVTISFRDDSTGFVPPGNVGVIMRVFFGEDECGNIDSSCVQTITIQDTEPPIVMCPEDITLECPADADTSLTGVATGMDNCTPAGSLILDFVDDSTGFDTPCYGGTITRTFIITDFEDNSASCTQIITIEDTTPPAFIVPADITLDCSTDITDLSLTGDVTGVTDCSEIADTTFTDTPGVDGCDGTGSILREWAVADACGNVATQVQTITLVDDVAPMVTAPADITISCEQDPTDTEITGDDVSALDNCSTIFIFDFTDVMTVDGCGNTGVIERTWTAEDECGNVGSAVQVITIIDDTPPVAICQDITLEFDQIDVTIDPSDVDGGSFDDCGDVTLELSQSTFNCFDFAEDTVQTVQLTVTDECGNTSVCDVQVTGLGGAGLVLNCPGPIFVNLDPGQCEAVVNYVITVEALCGSVDSVTLEQIDTSGLTSGDYFPIGTTIQTWIAYSPFGGDTAMCSFPITVVEYPEEPFMTCNDTVRLSADQNCEVFINPDMVLEGDTYGCYDDFLIESDDYGSGLGGILITDPELDEYFTVTVTNEQGISCWGVMIIEDKIPPQITCIDVTLACGESTEPIFIDPIQGTVVQTEFPGTPVGPGAGVVTTQEFNIVAPANAQVTDVNILIDLTHTWSADLDVVLIGPDGSIVDLAMDVCGTADNWSNVLFDDEAPGFACNGTPPPALTGPQQPAGNLSDFDGLDATGTWTLQITDDAGGDGGTLNIAELQVQYFVALPYAPNAFDACGPVTLTYEESEAGEDCDTSTITRIWTVTDESGNTASCVQTISITPLTLAGLEFPGNYEGSCNGSIHPSETGYPTLDGVDIVEGGLCNIFVTWEDKTLAGCGGGIKIIRTWTILNWCTLEIVEATQIIKLTDDDAPVITCPPDITVGTDPWYCTADVNLVQPEVYDPCGSDFTISAEATQGTLIDFGPGVQLADLPLGTTYVTWTAEDECGNSSECTVAITVVDDVPPVPLCDQHTVVSLTTDLNIEHGLTKVPAETFDDGSYDNCSGVSFSARRMDSCIDFDYTTGGPCVDDIPNGLVTSADRGTAYRPCVPFACCDVGAGPVMVELRVEDEAGNVNFCMVEVTVQDKLNPLIIAPPNIIVSCEFWFAAEETNGFVPQEEDVLTPVFGRVLDAFDNEPSDRQDIIIDDPGNDELPQPYNWGLDGWADDNCDVEITVRVRIFDDCSGEDLPPGAPDPYTVRLIERTFLARDGQGNTQTATQRIWVVDFEPFYISDTNCANQDRNDGVIWPCDREITVCTQEIPVDYPTIFDDNCSMVAVTYEDDVFEFVDGFCLKILRKWTVIDWCQYDVETGDGLWEYTQVIKINDQTGPIVIDCPASPVTYCAADSNISLPANNQVFLGEDDPQSTSCSVHVILEHDILEPCSDEVIYDVKVYPNNGSQFLQVLSKTTYEMPETNIGTLVFDSRSSSLLAIRQNGLPYNDRYCTPLIGGEKDYHRVLWTIEDGCGNITTCSYLFRLEDCKQPTPVCVGLSSVVMPVEGTVTIWASDFNASSFDDCTAADDLIYSFSGDEYTPSMEYNCDLLIENGSPTFLVEIWVADEGNDQDCNGVITWDERNKDYCTTFVYIEDNDDTCFDIGPLGGDIYTEEAAAVENVTVTLANALGVVTEVYVTGDNGQYHFVNPLLDHTITPKRNDDPTNGVSTLDLVRIQRHLLGLEPFDSPYKMIAADANNSQSISAIDLVEIRKLILGLYLNFPNNESWRFVDAEFVFQDVNNPWPFDEIIVFQGGTTMDEDFVAVKVGDVNGTVSANILGENDDLDGFAQRAGMKVAVEDRLVHAGEDVTIEVSGSNFRNMLGYQFTLNTQGLRLTGVDAGAIDVDEENIALHNGAITMSWHRVEGASVNEEDGLFTMTFQAQTTGMLSDMLSIGSSITKAEAYTESGAEISTIPVTLEFGKENVSRSAEFALFQNAPNPFEDVTTIGFELPEDMSAVITFYDVTGRVLETIEGDFNGGYNEVEISKAQLRSSGVVYYRLDADSFSATKKMIIVN